MPTADNLIKEGRQLFEDNRYNEAIEKFNQALESITDKTTQIQQQIDANFWLGRCYLAQAIKTKQLALFIQARSHFEQERDLAAQLSEEETQTQEKLYAEHWIGQTYLEQAVQTKKPDLFDKARSHFKQERDFAEQLPEEQNKTQEQIDAEHWIGRAYLEQAIQTKKPDLFDNARLYFEHKRVLAEQLSEEENKTQEQIYTESWIGRCYFEQAIQTNNLDLFNNARSHFEERQSLATLLPEGKNKKQQQIYAEFWLGRCYFEQAIQAKKPDLFDKARKYFTTGLNLAKKQTTENSIKNQKIAKKWLARCYFKQGIQEKNQDLFEKYFKAKKLLIQENLSNLKKELKEPISSILAVLSISPFEFNKPLAHYTNPNVCEKLLSIDRNKSNKDNDKNKTPLSSMRMNSSAYMNDPYEGKSLTEFLGVQDISLENRTPLAEKNAYFSCFSSRVNDLNQFRLYGKMDNIEASGCCLVFNKYGDWIKEPDIRASYAKLSRSNNLDRDIQQEGIGNLSSDNLPLYQIAYIFYRDDYIAADEYDALNNAKEKFGIRLKPISPNNKWEALRRKKLAEALIDLKAYFQDKTRSHSPDDQLALEYIRYLFKDYAFRDEEEFRLLKIEEIGSEEVKYCPVTNATYIEYGTICQQLDEVILGTNYEYTKDGLKAEVFRHLLKQQYPHIQVFHSSLPIAMAARKKG